MSKIVNNLLCTNCVQSVGADGQKPADKRTQVIPPSRSNDRFAPGTMDNSHFYTLGRTLFTALFPQAKSLYSPVLMSELSLFSTVPTITTITYI
jgi:hypothetical protein